MKSFFSKMAQTGKESNGAKKIKAILGTAVHESTTDIQNQINCIFNITLLIPIEVLTQTALEKHQQLRVRVSFEIEDNVGRNNNK